MSPKRFSFRSPFNRVDVEEKGFLRLMRVCVPLQSVNLQFLVVFFGVFVGCD